MTPENRNLIMAVALSMIVLLGWQIFVIQPEMEKEAAEQERIAAEMAQSAATANDSGQPSASAASGTPAIINNTAPAKAVDTAKRIVIDAPLVRGSFSVRGARLDDVILTSYNETLDENSENIHFLKKISSDTPFFAEFGWSSPDSGQTMPSADSLWSADRDVLSPATPVTLTWDNGQGLQFTRRISINDDYLFVFEDSVTSSLPGDITLYPYGLVRRHGTPATTGMYILHEGPLGVFDETLSEEDYDGSVSPTNTGWLRYCRHRRKTIISGFSLWPEIPIGIRLTLLIRMACYWLLAAPLPAKAGCLPAPKKWHCSIITPNS